MVMERDPDIRRGDAGIDAEPRFDDRDPLDLSHLPPCPGIPSTDEEISAAIARGRESVAAGRFYPHSLVSKWLLTWGKPGRKPFKEWLAAQNG